MRCPITGRRLATIAALDPVVWAQLHFVAAPFCHQCGAPFAVDYGHKILCPSCIADPPDFDRARAAVVYGDVSHQLINGFKSRDRTELAPVLARWLVQCGRSILGPDKKIAPIPLYPAALARRRFNQSGLLAGALSNLTALPVRYDLIRRRRATAPQKDLSASARRRNVAGAFEADKTQVAGAHIVLIDDVLTTGATISAAARALKRAGAASVEALVVARVVKGGGGAI